MAAKSITITKIRNAKGETRYRVDYYDQWSRRQRPSFATEREAKEFKKEVTLKLSGRGDDQSSSDVPIHEAIKKYDELKSASKASHSEERRYFEKMYGFLLDEIGIYSVQEIRPVHLEELQIFLRKRVSASTVNRHFNTYRNFFSCLMRWGFISKNPSEGLENLPINPTIRKVWNLEQVEAVLKEIQPHYGDFLFFMAHTGCRNKEARGLTWDDVDFGRRTILVRSMKGNRGARIRVVPLTQELALFLSGKLERARELGKGAGQDTVFFNTHGNPIQNQALDEAVREVAERLNEKARIAGEPEIFDGLTPYGLRHFLVTSMQAENQAEEKIRRIVGHSANSNVTAGYTHLNIHHLRTALEATEQAQKLKRNGHHWTRSSK